MATRQWIPLSERQPPTIGTYLICTDKFGIVLAHWYGDRFGVGRASKRITHWMPLPKPPKPPKKQKPITAEVKTALYKMGQLTHQGEVNE
jgi:hypothetical protein